ncbi:MAG: hypothetical protein K2W95_35200 [Candidatus Obscuribacterales bacterium]|nr:hypothetical protein [Candidatus Obscuribacterales bacterium]
MSSEEKLRNLLAAADIAATVDTETDDESPDCGCLCIDLHGRHEHFTLTPERRHGQDGLRVLRYVLSDPTIPMDDWRWDWDNWYQFHPSLEAFVRAVSNRDYAESRKAF